MLGRLKLIVVFEAIVEALISCGNVSVQLLRDGAFKKKKRVILLRHSLFWYNFTIPALTLPRGTETLSRSKFTVPGY